ncbi:MAG: ribonuclease HII [Candidatus Sungbacteria bacterium]|nr:ribonuclease HII [Candidatus Sungbacteria bacterium]
MHNKNKYVNIIGIDEAGRGPLAGPLVVGGVMMRSSGAAGDFFAGIRDSKKLTEKKREEWYRKIVACRGLAWAYAVITPETVDKINIARAAHAGAFTVYKKLAHKESRVHVLLDGSLHLPCGISQETIIKGDEKIPLISAASIIAKVTRDRMMRRLHKKFPQYSFDTNKGYGTLAHMASILRHGLTPVHRITFCRFLNST